MKIGIDSYCYHRYFGEVYPVQSSPDTTMTIEDFLSRTVELGAQGVSLESCFLPQRDPAYLSELRARLDELELERVYAWGHPNGLLGGKSPEAYEDMLQNLPRIVKILEQAGYRGMLTVELDYLHSDYESEEDSVLVLSIENLPKLI